MYVPIYTFTEQIKVSIQCHETTGIEGRLEWDNTCVSFKPLLLCFLMVCQNIVALCRMVVSYFFAGGWGGGGGGGEGI